MWRRRCAVASRPLPAPLVEPVMRRSRVSRCACPRRRPSGRRRPSSPSSPRRTSVARWRGTAPPSRRPTAPASAPSAASASATRVAVPSRCPCAGCVTITCTAHQSRWWTTPVACVVSRAFSTTAPRTMSATTATSGALTSRARAPTQACACAGAAWLRSA